jgi:uncharacterized tellurite resistance protein B-like protein
MGMELITRLQRLFGNATAKPADGLVQPQREAIIDLLLVSMYADNRIATSEDEMLETELYAFSWESGISPENFLNASTARIRAALVDEAKTQALLESIRQRLGSAAAKQRALALCDKLLQSDQNSSEAETNFQKRVKGLLSG